jgi:hypothetical protein
VPKDEFNRIHDIEEIVGMASSIGLYYDRLHMINCRKELEEDFDEYDYSPYSCFLNTIEFEPGKFRIKKLAHKIPMVYSLTALKK